MKNCSQCNQIKPVSEFNKNSKKRDGYQSMCRDCSRSYYKNYYKTTNKERKRLYTKNRAAAQEIRMLIAEKKSVPCMDCGQTYPTYVMDFDHRNPKDKSFMISSSVRARSIELVRKEIEKCDVVCANCHRIRTHSDSTGGIGRPT